MEGQTVSHYEIKEKLGQGGMGEVYRATDTKLNRDVALKLLPEMFANDEQRMGRFSREAQVLASLNHPNIASIYGLEESKGQRVLVMELVEGEDLSDRIARGPIPLEEALSVALQIAEALENAHEKGIIHRDLKPANIKLTPEGKVKVLDFGLAKAVEGPVTASQSGAGLSQSPTMAMAATQAGIILGTAAYMAPEQARGKTVDRRADIWAFGAVLYEMLTGTRAFEGENIADTLGNVMKVEPNWDRCPASIPPRVVQVMRACLQKNPKQRMDSAQGVRLALEGAFETVATADAAFAAAAASRGLLVWKAAFAVAVLVAAALVLPAQRSLREPPPPDTRIARLTMGLAPAERLGPADELGRPSRTAFAISPDGGTVVFSGETTVPGSPPITRLFRRPLAEAEAVVIPGTEGATYPFFSPDGQWVGFASGNTLKKVALSGGPPIDLCDIIASGIDLWFAGASWGDAGVIAFARFGLWTVAESGGTPKAAVESGLNTGRVFAPAMLPDGQTVLFTAVPGDEQWEESHVDAINLTTKKRTTLLTNAADARYSPTGHLVFVRNATLLAVPFDATRVVVTGAAVPLLAGVMQSTNASNSSRETGMGQFALSASGMLLYAAGDRYPTWTSTLVRVDRKGDVTTLAEITGRLVGLRLSPSGTRVVAFKSGDGSRASDIWTYDLPSGTATRLTTTGDADWPLLSPDGTSVIFRRSGSAAGIYALPLNGRALGPSDC